ncbi:hypothetical protein JCM3765_000600 [Sporobolomyces pararoseus]
MEGELLIASTSAEPYQERIQSPSQEGEGEQTSHQQDSGSSVKLGKRKLSESSPPPPPSSSLDPPTTTTTTTTAIVESSSTPQYPSVAPLPVFAPPPPTLPPHPSFEFFSTRSHPFNKHSFRYTPCGPSPESPLPIPPQRLIESEPREIRWSWEDRSVFTYLTRDAKTVSTDKGWRGIRSNVGVRQGDWFWEFKIERSNNEQKTSSNLEPSEEGIGNNNDKSWVRVGIGRRESGLNAPVGVDGYSYGLRDKTGEKLTKSLPTVYGKPFKTGSTVGVYLSLPTTTTDEDNNNSSSSSSVRDPKKIQRKRVPILYKNQLYFEQLEYPTSKEMDELLVDPILKAKQLEQEESKKKKKKKSNQAPGVKVSTTLEENQGPPLRELPILKGSKLGFWIDGEFQGLAFENLYDFIPLMKHSSKLYPSLLQKKEKSNRLVTVNNHDDGTTGYYPFVSVFGGGIVSLNSGPDFKFSPLDRDVNKLLGLEEEEASQEGRKRWRPLGERYQEFYEEQKRLDDLDELQQIEQLKLVRDKEQARIQRQLEKAERAAAAAVNNNNNNNNEGAGGGGVSKKQKISNTELVGNGLAVLGQFQNQVIGTAKGQEESPVNSPKPSE